MCACIIFFMILSRIHHHQVDITIYADHDIFFFNIKILKYRNGRRVPIQDEQHGLLYTLHRYDATMDTCGAFLSLFANNVDSAEINFGLFFALYNMIAGPIKICCLANVFQTKVLIHNGKKILKKKIAF